MLKIKNRILEAVVKLFLFSACVHILLTLIYSLIHFDVKYINYFYVIGLSNFFPNFVDTVPGQFSSFFILIVAFLVIYLYFTDKKK